MRLDEFLQQCRLGGCRTRSRAQKRVKSGLISINGKVVRKAGTRVKVGDTLDIRLVHTHSGKTTTTTTTVVVVTAPQPASESVSTNRRHAKQTRRKSKAKGKNKSSRRLPSLWYADASQTVDVREHPVLAPPLHRSLLMVTRVLPVFA